MPRRSPKPRPGPPCASSSWRPNEIDRCGSPAAAVSDVCGRWTRDGLTVDPEPWNPGLKYGARRRKSYEGQGARNSILAGARPRDRIRWRRPVRSLAKAACGRGGPYVFKSRHGLLVLGRMARTRADVREAELLEDLADRALVVSDAEALGHDLLQVHPAPAHDSMHGALRPGFNDLGELRQLLRREARRVAFRPAVLEPFGAPFIEAVHPVPQRLAVHATDPRGIGPAHPIQHRRKRQQTSTLVGVLGGRRKTPQLVGRKVRSHRHRCRHGTNPPAPWNQPTSERGIGDESERKAFGITGSFEDATDASRMLTNS